MREDWNDELRRAYDQGYWDARREFERHLQLEHSRELGGGSRGEYNEIDGERRGYNYMREYWREEERPRSGYGGGEQRQSGFGPVEYDREGSRYGYRGDDPGGYRDYPPGDRRSAFEGRGNEGFIEKAGHEIRSWFSDDDDDRRRESNARSRGGDDNRWW